MGHLFEKYAWRRVPPNREYLLTILLFMQINYNEALFKKKKLMGSMFQESKSAYLFLNLILNECLHPIKQESKGQVLIKVASLLEIFLDFLLNFLLDFLFMADCFLFFQRTEVIVYLKLVASLVIYNTKNQ